MTTRTNKHFLYKWLGEDKFGEYTLRKPYTSRFTKTLLRRIWTVLSRGRRLHRTTLKIRRTYYKKLNRITFMLSIFRKSRLTDSLKKTKKLNKIKSKSLLIRRKRRLAAFSGRNMPRIIASRQISIYSNRKLNLRLRNKKVLGLWGKRIGSLRYKNVQHLRTIGLAPQHRRSFKRSRLPRLTVYQSTHKVRTIRVKRHEIRALKNIHALHYYNIKAPYSTLLKITRSKNSDIKVNNYIASCELKLSSILLRSGFFENAYIVDNIAKRGPFLINGLSTNSGSVTLKVWDYLTLSPIIWWYVYARLISFSKRWIRRTSRRKQKLSYYSRKIIRRILFTTRGKKKRKVRSVKNSLLFTQRKRRKANYVIKVKRRLKILKRKTISLKNMNTPLTSRKSSIFKSATNRYSKYKKTSRYSHFKGRSRQYNKHYVNRRTSPNKKRLINFTKFYWRLKDDLINKLSVRHPISSSQLQKLNRKTLIKSSKFANRYSIIFSPSSYMEISYKMLSILIHRPPYKSTDSNLPSSLRSLKKLNRIQSAFRPRIVTYLRNKNRYS